MQLKSTESNGGSADKSALEGLSVLDFSLRLKNVPLLVFKSLVN
jgi:hypothetical protein